MGERGGKRPCSFHRRVDALLRAGPVLLMTALMLCVALAQGALFPELTQDGQKEKNGTIVDVGHADQGYIMVSHSGAKKKLKARVSCGKQSYTYDLNGEGEFEVFPLQMGSGSYTVAVFEQVKGSKYQGVSSIQFDAQIEDECLPYLYPNQYAWYEEDSKAVAEAQTLCAGLDSDEKKIEAVRTFVTSQFMYDYKKAMNVQNVAGYLPVVDNVLEEKQGICFDLSALVCCMLRTQGIPVQMVIGYADKNYHAWNRVYEGGQWRLIDTTSEVTGAVVRQYTPERYY